MNFDPDKHSCQKNPRIVGFETTLSGSLLVFNSIKSCTLMSAKLLILNLVLQGIQMASDLSEAVFLIAFVQ